MELPGRGIGLIANRTIHRGELIMVNTAIAIFHNKAVNKKSPDFDTNLQLLKSTIDKLPAKSQQLFMSQVAHDPNNNPYLERIFTNAFGVYFGGEEHMVAFPETARMNHDCRPNAMYYVDYKELTHYTHASRIIYAGEEITDTYVDPLQTHSKRRAAVKAWGFNCTCSLCTQLPEFIEESDRRITHIKALTAFMKGDTGGDERDRRVIRGTPEMAELLVSLYEQERLYTSIVDGYLLAALSYSAAGIELLAVKWAVLAVEAGLIHFGPRDRDLVDMRSLLDDPRAHWSWNFKAREGN